MIPEKLTEKHFEEATIYIDLNGTPADRASVHYDVIINGKIYPPKYLISIANKIATGKEYPANAFNAVEAKNYFLRRGYNLIDRRLEAINFIENESDFPEGSPLFKMHKQLERDKNISNRAKIKRFLEKGSLECEICGIDFHKIYGDLGRGYIEAHHKIPVSELKGDKKTKISDFALVCSNCHRMLHRKKTSIPTQTLKNIIEETRKLNKK